MLQPVRRHGLNGFLLHGFGPRDRFGWRREGVRGFDFERRDGIRPGLDGRLGMVGRLGLVGRFGLVGRLSLGLFFKFLNLRSFLRFLVVLLLLEIPAFSSCLDSGIFLRLSLLKSIKLLGSAAFPKTESIWALAFKIFEFPLAVRENKLLIR